MKLSFILACSIFIISCNKNHTTTTPTGNNPNTGNNTTTGTDSTYRKFTGTYQLFDSSRHSRVDPPHYFDTTIHVTLNRSLVVCMDTDRYISVGTDTFKYFKTSYYGHEGYYSYFSTPLIYRSVILTTDSLWIDSTSYMGNNNIHDNIMIKGFRVK